MLNKTAFEAMRKELEQFDALREELIKTSRDILKASKAAIYSLHRNDAKDASTKLKSAKNAIVAVEKLIKKDPHLATQPAYHEALEEYVEASCYHGFITDKKLPTAEDLNVETEVSLPGLCDLVGELVRAAINASITGNYRRALDIRGFVSAVYDELLLFDFRNSPLRRKFDSIKYGLEKLEDLILNLSLREKIKIH